MDFAMPQYVSLVEMIGVADIAAIGRAAEEAGADALAVMNTIPGMVIDLQRRRPVLANVTGGLSGPAIRPLAVRLTYQLAGAVRIPTRNRSRCTPSLRQMSLTGSFHGLTSPHSCHSATTASMSDSRYLRI